MKVLVGHFNSESNEHAYQKMGFENFIFKYGKDSIDAMGIRDIFENNNIEIIPSIYANGHPGGLVTKDAFDFILTRILHALKKNLNEIDGIFLYLHGASKVEDLEGDSGEHKIVKEIRKITGPYLPIAVVMDPHGNLSEQFVANTTIVRCYRHSPHTDILETHRKVAKLFVDLLKNKRYLTPVYRKVPIIIGGEKSVSTDEPMVSINKYLDEVEKDERILSASFHIGYLRHDGDKLGCSVVVVPCDEKHKEYANETADKIYDFVLARRYQFHYHGIVDEPGKALERAINYQGRPVFLTDSGDNCGAGADGYSNYVLRQCLDLKDYNNKTILIAGIVDQQIYPVLLKKDIGEKVELDLGMGLDKQSTKVHIKGTVISKGVASIDYIKRPDIGSAITIKLDNYPISIIVLGESVSYTELEQFKCSNVDILQYDVIVVKQGYISPDFKAISPFCIMSLTDGPTNQRTEKLVFKRIKRPMFPYDNIDYRIEESNVNS